jgi:hypothetical protein
MGVGLLVGMIRGNERPSSQETGIREQGSGIREQGSGIRDQRSEIREQGDGYTARSISLEIGDLEPVGLKHRAPFVAIDPIFAFYSPTTSRMTCPVGESQQ